MSLLKILYFPDNRLRTIAQPVAQVDTEIKNKINDMLDTMYENKGIGLAASQVNFHYQLIVIDLQDNIERPKIFINLEIIEKSGTFINEEGCLSIPGVYAEIDRAETITIRALDLNGDQFTLTADGLFAVCLQHELDHLNGKLFVDYLSPLKQLRIKQKIEKAARLEAKQG